MAEFNCGKCGANCQHLPVSNRIAKAETMNPEEFLRAAVGLEKSFEELERLAAAENPEFFKKIHQARNMAGALKTKASQMLAAEDVQKIEKQVLKQQILVDPSRLDKMSYAELRELMESNNDNDDNALLHKQAGARMSEIVKDPSKLDKLSYAELADMGA